jgi:CheY-like chemotaxis protein
MTPVTILFVDDDAIIAMAAVEMLTGPGHMVIETHSGPKALKILQDGRSVNLLLTDYAMPGMTGLELARAARELQPNLPILIATGRRLGIPKVAKTLSAKGPRKSNRVVFGWAVRRICANHS